MYTKFNIVIEDEAIEGKYNYYKFAVNLAETEITSYMADEIDGKGVTVIKLVDKERKTDTEYLTVAMSFKQFDKFLEEEKAKYPPPRENTQR